MNKRAVILMSGADGGIMHSSTRGHLSDLSGVSFWVHVASQITDVLVV